MFVVPGPRAMALPALHPLLALPSTSSFFRLAIGLVPASTFGLAKPLREAHFLPHGVASLMARRQVICAVKPAARRRDRSVP
jgi:membrane-associated PAP2 superfamily phosphatase